MKDVLKKVSGPITKELIDTITFKLNQHISPGQGSASMRFLGRAPRSNLPNPLKRSVDRDDLVKSRMEKQIKLAEKKGRQSRDEFKNGDKVLLRCPKTKRWVQEGLVVQERNSDNGVPVSFVIELDTGHRTIRHKSHMRHCVKSDMKISER